jgi:hypothetical protein
MQNNDFNWLLIRVTLSVASSRLGGDYLVSPNYGFTPELRGPEVRSVARVSGPLEL